MYVNLLTDGGSKDWGQFTRLLGLSSAYELRTRIEAALAKLNEFNASVSSPLYTSLVIFLEELKRLENEPIAEDTSTTSPKSQNVFVPQGKKLDKFELKAVSFITIVRFLKIDFKFCFLQQLMATAKQARPTTKFDEIRTEIVEWLNTDLRNGLRPPSTSIFHEIFYAGSQVQSN